MCVTIKAHNLLKLSSKDTQRRRPEFQRTLLPVKVGFASIRANYKQLKVKTEN